MKYLEALFKRCFYRTTRSIVPYERSSMPVGMLKAMTFKTMMDFILQNALKTGLMQNSLQHEIGKDKVDCSLFVMNPVDIIEFLSIWETLNGHDKTKLLKYIGDFKTSWQATYTFPDEDEPVFSQYWIQMHQHWDEMRKERMISGDRNTDFKTEGESSSSQGIDG